MIRGRARLCPPAAALALLVLQTLAAQPAPSIERAAPQALRVGSIDFFGARKTDPAALRPRLRLREGDTLSREAAAALKDELERSRPPLPEVERLTIDFVCCNERMELAVFVGVQERGREAPRFRTAPTGTVRLPEEVRLADRAAQAAVSRAVQAGRAAEDDSQGRALLTQDPEARRRQEALVPLAAKHLARLREVLRDAADPRQRAAAARVLGYAADRRAVAADLAAAAGDPDAEVRNDAVRTLAVFQRAPDATAPVPVEPFLQLLESSTWTDLNKAAFALEALTRRRDPAVLALLRARALPVLIDIARWRSRSHAHAGAVILGRIGGLDDERIQQLFTQGDVEALVGAASAAR